jgi:hypothetical protein
MENKDLWPSFEDLPKFTSPRTILAEQARFLEQKTKNVLTVELTSGRSKVKAGKLYTFFKIVAPLINNYSYQLFTLYHDAFLYPCEIKFRDKYIECSTEESLKKNLEIIFNDKDTIKVVSSLLSQSAETNTKELE